MKAASTIEDIKTAMSRLDSIDTNEARLQTSKHRIIIQEDGGLSAKACAEFASAKAGLEMAGPAREQLTAALISLINGAGRDRQKELRRHAESLHEAIDKAIRERVLSGLNEDVRDAIDVYSTKPWKDERQARPNITQEVPWCREEDRLDETKGHGFHAIAVLEVLEAEIIRATSVLKKYSVTVAA